MSPDDVGGLTSPKLLTIIWVVTVIAITLVISRFAIRLYVVKKTTFDNVLASDVLIAVALATLITMAGCYVQIIPTMFDVDLAAAHKVPSSPETFEERADHYLKVQFAIIILFWTCVWSVKISILVFYKSLFDRLSRMYLYAWWAVVAFVALTYVGCWAMQFESCSPLKVYFQIGHCNGPRNVRISNDSLYYSTAVDIACDLLTLWSQIEASVAVVVSSLPSFGWLLNKRARSNSAYKRRNPSSSGRSTSGIRSPRYPAEAMRLGTIRQGTFLEIDSQDQGDSFDHAAAAEREGAPNTMISKGHRTESQEDVMQSIPHNRIHLWQDMVRTEETL